MITTTAVVVKKCTLIIIDGEDREADVFIVPQEEITERMRQLFANSLHSDELDDDEFDEWLHVVEQLGRYKIAAEEKPFGPPQIIVDRIRAHY